MFPLYEGTPLCLLPRTLQPESGAKRRSPGALVVVDEVVEVSRKGRLHSFDDFWRENRRQRIHDIVINLFVN